MLQFNIKMCWSANTGEARDDTGCNKSPRCVFQKANSALSFSGLCHAGHAAFLLPHALKQCYEGGSDFSHTHREHLHLYGSSDPIICPHASGRQSVGLDMALCRFFSNLHAARWCLSALHQPDSVRRASPWTLMLTSPAMFQLRSCLFSLPCAD